MALRAAEPFSAAELLALDLPEPRWAVPSILPEGLAVLAGKPKVGKSWLALGLAVAVAQGSAALGATPVQSGDVLYLALEDTPRRLQERLVKVLGPAPAPSGLNFSTAWPRLDKGGGQALRCWLDAHRAARLVIIDTFAKLRPRHGGGSDAYREDYADTGLFKRLADDHGVALVVVTHQRKMAADDPLDTVSGTLGISGAADTLLILTRRARTDAEAELHVTGRDVETADYRLAWDGEGGTWTLAAQTAEPSMSTERLAIFPSNFPKARASGIRVFDMMSSIRELLGHAAGRQPLTLSPLRPRSAAVCMMPLTLTSEQ